MAKEIIQSTVLTGGTPLALGANAQVMIRDADSAALVSLWTDRAGTIVETNPFNADTNGQFKVYADPNRLQITVVAGGETRIWEDFQLFARNDFWNKVINPEMNIQQEGMIFTGVGALTDKYTVEQWLIHTAGSPAARVTVSQLGSVFSGFAFSIKIDCTTAMGAPSAGQLFTWETRLEAQDQQDLEYGAATANSMILTFRVKSPKTGIHCVALYQPDGNRSFIREFTVNVANTIEEKIVSFPGDIAGTINNNNGEGLRLVWPLIVGSDFQVIGDQWTAGQNFATVNQQNLLDNTANNFEITGIDLYIGLKTRVFPHRPFAAELALCQRFMEKSYNYGVNPGTNHISGLYQSSGTASSTNQIPGVRFKTSKLHMPTIVIYPKDGSPTGTVSDTIFVDAIAGNVANSVGTEGFRAVVSPGYSSNQWNFHFTAIARL